jgi:hypothetical protein
LAVLLIVLFFPVGIALVWRTAWSEGTKVLVTVGTVAVIGAAMLPVQLMGVHAAVAMASDSLAAHHVAVSVR